MARNQDAMPFTYEGLLKAGKNPVHYKLCTYCGLFYFAMAFPGHYAKEREERGLPSMRRPRRPQPKQ